MIEFYDCEFVDLCQDAIDVDMYFERESRCGAVKSKELADKFSSFDKDSIIRFIEPYSDYEREAPNPGKEYKESVKKLS